MLQNFYANRKVLSKGIDNNEPLPLIIYIAIIMTNVLKDFLDLNVGQRLRARSHELLLWKQWRCLVTTHMTRLKSRPLTIQCNIMAIWGVQRSLIKFCNIEEVLSHILSFYLQYRSDGQC